MAAVNRPSHVKFIDDNLEAASQISERGSISGDGGYVHHDDDVGVKVLATVSLFIQR